MKKEKRTKTKISDQERKLNIYRLICIVLILVLITVLVLWAKDCFIINQAQNRYSELQEQVNNVSAADQGTEIGKPKEQEILEELGITVPDKNLDWELLWETNADIYAWIYVPGTNVDYPILQHPYNDSYYLNYNMDGSKGRPGCIYTELQNSRDFTDYNTVIYGHNMSSGTMFKTLHYFEDAEFFAEHPYIYIYTENGVLVYEIFAAYDTDNSHILNTNDFSTESGYAAYLEGVFANPDEEANFREGVTVTTDDYIVTLSTCGSGGSSRRYLVQAVLVNEAALPEADEDTAGDGKSDYIDVEVEIK